MEGVFLIVFGVAVAAMPFLLYAERRARRAQLQGWRSAAETLGLQEVEARLSPVGPRLSGRAGGRRVSFERALKEQKVHVTRMTISGNSGISLRLEAARGGVEKWLGQLDEREIELGDDPFDAEVEVHGAVDRVRALLDAETRTLVRRMLHSRLEAPGRRAVSIRGSAWLEHGDFHAELLEDPTPPLPSDLAEAAGALLAIAELFEGPANVPERLAGNLEREPQWRVRLRGLELLATSYPHDRATTAALRRGLDDDVPEVRLQAAIALGEEGRRTLLEIATAEGVEDATAAHAIDVLGARFGADAAEPVLRRALRLRRVYSADACIQVLGRAGGPSAPLLAKVLSVETGPLAVAAARALKTCASADAEDALLAALGRDQPELTVVVLEALGRCGSARAVLPIKEAAEGSAGDAVRRAARQAVAEIQSRLPGASPGQLSLAGGEAGRLSLADDDPRGRVSLPETS